MGTKRILDKRFCDNCKKDRTYATNRGYLHWYNHDDQWYCEKCNNKIFKNPRWHPIMYSTQFRFKDRVIYTKQKQRTGYCSKCPNNIFNGSCKRTHMHHWTYITAFPWFGREEVCVSCHAKLKRRN